MQHGCGKNTLPYCLKRSICTAGKNLENYFSEAHVCTKDGNYGGKYFKAGQNYGALDVCALSKEERAKFNFNHDALDLFEKNFKAEVSEYHTPYNTRFAFRVYFRPHTNRQYKAS